MRRVLSGLIAALVLLATPALAQRGAKQDSVKPAPKAGAKADTTKPGAKVPPKTDQTKKADTKQAGKALANQKADQAKPAAPPAAAKPDSASSVSQSGSKAQMTIMREIFTYDRAGRRDPLLSLANTSALRPLLTEIECIGIMYDEDGHNSEAIMRSLDKKQSYRVKVGQALGRATVSQITRREVVFTIDEYGFNRQVSMPVKPDTSKARTP